MPIITRRGLMAGAGMAAVCPAWAQTGYPSRNITLIAPVAPGSQTDVFSRVLSMPLGQRLG
jgi:tripartite-type tricarboxylate transporter receptor subunit TctC